MGADYKPIPGVNWAADTRAPSERTIKIAMVLFDFEDQPFVVTLPKRSDPFGNPQIDPIKREDVPRFYHDFWNKPQPLNYGRSVHEYWMELSHGRIGVEFTPFGPYRIPGPYAKGHGNAEMADDRVARRRRRGHPQGIRPRHAHLRRLRRDHGVAGIRRDEVPDARRHQAAVLQPGGSEVCWLDTRYTDWTSWLAAPIHGATPASTWARARAPSATRSRTRRSASATTTTIRT